MTVFCRNKLGICTFLLSKYAPWFSSRP